MITVCNKNHSASKSSLMALWPLKEILMDFDDFSVKMPNERMQLNDIYCKTAIGKCVLYG